MVLKISLPWRPQPFLSAQFTNLHVYSNVHTFLPTAGLSFLSRKQFLLASDHWHMPTPIGSSYTSNYPFRFQVYQVFCVYYCIYWVHYWYTGTVQTLFVYFPTNTSCLQYLSPTSYIDTRKLVEILCTVQTVRARSLYSSWLRSKSMFNVQQWKVTGITIITKHKILTYLHIVIIYTVPTLFSGVIQMLGCIGCFLCYSRINV